MIPDKLWELVGEWGGTNAVYLTPEAQPEKSQTTARVYPTAMGKFLVIAYNWAFANEQQEGLLLLGAEGTNGTLTASWIDSFHNGDRIMLCSGILKPDSPFIVIGSYPAPPGPDWGWKLALELEGEANFALRMFNITPDGLEYLAVEAIYTRLA